MMHHLAQAEVGIAKMQRILPKTSGAVLIEGLANSVMIKLPGLYIKNLSWTLNMVYEMHIAFSLL
jgi:hypothetical protein